jgi:hypothetical protein
LQSLATRLQEARKQVTDENAKNFTLTCQLNDQAENLLKKQNSLATAIEIFEKEKSELDEIRIQLREKEKVIMSREEAAKAYESRLAYEADELSKREEAVKIELTDAEKIKTDAIRILNEAKIGKIQNEALARDVQARTDTLNEKELMLNNLQKELTK